MGYDSTFSGSLTPSRKIPKALADRINNAELDVRIATAGGGYEDYEPGTVVPAASTMHGYDWVEDIVKVQRLLAKQGITLRGDIYRSGENDDFDKVEVRKGRIYYRPGWVTYGKREEKGAAEVTKHAIRVFHVRQVKGETRKRLLGWVGPCGLMSKSHPVYPPQKVLGKPVMDRPPVTALEHKTRAEAEKLAGELARSNPARRYDVVTWEDEV